MFELRKVYDFDDKMRSDDRVLKIQPIEGKKPKDVTGMIDPRLFTGENNVHATMDPQTTLWSIRYEKGNMPPVFNQRFTSFKQAKKFADTYFKNRNMEVVEVID